MLIETDDFCCWHINTIQTTNPPKTKRGSISHATSTSAQNRHGSIHKTDLISIIVRPQLIANRVKHDLNSVHCSFVIWNLWILSRAEKSPFGVGVGVCVWEGGFPSERGDWSESALCVRGEAHKSTCRPQERIGKDVNRERSMLSLIASHTPLPPRGKLHHEITTSLKTLRLSIILRRFALIGTNVP